MELTKQQRHLVYTRLLEETLAKGLGYGLCFILERFCKFDQNDNLPDEWLLLLGGVRVCKTLPELYAYKPEERSPDWFWFDLNVEGHNTRIEILKKVIEETR